MTETTDIRLALENLRRNGDSLLLSTLPKAVELRHRIHQDPRVSGNERDTAELLVEAIGLTDGVWVADGFLSRLGSSYGPAVALRAELDALPIAEESDVEWASRNGAGHLCGHDVHMAGLYSAITAIRSAGVPIPLIAALQPREESLPSGAEDLIGSDWLQQQSIRAFIGAHLQPRISKGSVSGAPGAVNASADEFTIIVRGTAAHGAYPHLGRDPLVALSAIVMALQHLVSRRTDPMVPSVITVGEIRGGSSFNAIPETASLRGTLRAYKEKAREELQEMLRSCAGSVAAGYGCTAELTVGLGEPVLYNDEHLASVIAQALEAAEFTQAAAMRSCGADDFSFYGTRFPALMVFVGVGDASDNSPGLHHPRFLPDDSAVLDVARVFLTSYIAAGNLILDEAELQKDAP